MMRKLGKKLGRGAVPLLAAGLVAAMAACDGILDVDTGGIVVPEDIDGAGPGAVPTIINGFVGDFHVAMDDVARKTGMLVDEFILAGTFPTRVQVDRRRILVNNATLTVDMYVPLHRARLAADTAVFLFQERLTDPEFEEVVGTMNQGIVMGTYYGAKARLHLAQVYCWSILTGMADETAPLMPDERMQQALSQLQEAEQLATTHGIENYRLASILGQARAQAWLGNWEQAAALASEVPTDFVLWVEYSANDPAQFNRVYTLSWGDTEVIRYSVGDGSVAARGNELFEFFDEFVDMTLIEPNPPGRTSFDASIPVMAQRLYRIPQADIYAASGREARLIEAEAAVRGGDPGTAQDILNDLRETYASVVASRWDIQIPEAAEAAHLGSLTVSGSLTDQVKTVADERARELWLTGDRHATARRLRLDPDVDIDLFPPFKAAIDGGDDIAFPIVQREIDNNTNLAEGQACPAGQSSGSWE